MIEILLGQLAEIPKESLVSSDFELLIPTLIAAGVVIIVAYWRFKTQRYLADKWSETEKYKSKNDKKRK